MGDTFRRLAGGVQAVGAFGDGGNAGALCPRAGGATEAEEAGVKLELIRGAMTHSNSTTTVRYIRRRAAKIADVAEAGQKKRAADEGGTE